MDVVLGLLGLPGISIGLREGVCVTCQSATVTFTPVRAEALATGIEPCFAAHIAIAKGEEARKAGSVLIGGSAAQRYVPNV